MNHLAHPPKSNVSSSGAIDIFIFKNGQDYSPPRKYHLTLDELDSWDMTRYHLAQLLYGSTYSKVDLYSLSGNQIASPLELCDGNAYVTVGPTDNFKNTGYNKYLIKASRSWEKRQKRRSEILELSKDKVLRKESSVINITNRSCDFSKRIRPKSYCKKQCESPVECMQDITFSGLRYSSDTQPLSVTKQKISQKYPIKNKEKPETSAHSKMPIKMANNSWKYGKVKGLQKPNEMVLQIKGESMKNKTVPTKSKIPTVTKKRNEKQEIDKTNSTVAIQEKKSLAIEKTRSSPNSCTILAYKSSKTVTLTNDKSEIMEQNDTNIHNGTEKLSRHSNKKENIQKKIPLPNEINKNEIISVTEITKKQGENLILLMRESSLKKTSEIETEITNQLMNVSDVPTPVHERDFEQENKFLENDLSPKQNDYLGNPITSPTETRIYNFEILDQTQSGTNTISTDKIYTRSEQDKNKGNPQLLFTNNYNENDSSLIVCEEEVFMKTDKTVANDVKPSKIRISLNNENTLLTDKTNRDIKAHHSTHSCCNNIKKDGTDKFTTYIQKGEILDLKLTIEVVNNNKPCSKNNKIEKESQVNLVLCKSLYQISDKNEILIDSINKGKIHEKYARVIIIQCLCSPNDAEPENEDVNKKLFIVPSETIAAVRCNCDRNSAAVTQENGLKPNYTSTAHSVHNARVNEIGIAQKEYLRVPQMVANFEQNIKSPRTNSLEVIKKKLITKKVESLQDQATPMICRCNVENTENKIENQPVDDNAKKNIQRVKTYSKTEFINPKPENDVRDITEKNTPQDKNNQSYNKKDPEQNCYCQCLCNIDSQKSLKATKELITDTPVRPSLIPELEGNVLTNSKNKKSNEEVKQELTTDTPIYHGSRLELEGNILTNNMKKESNEEVKQQPTTDTPVQPGLKPDLEGNILTTNMKKTSNEEVKQELTTDTPVYSGSRPKLGSNISTNDKRMKSNEKVKQDTANPVQPSLMPELEGNISTNYKKKESNEEVKQKPSADLNHVLNEIKIQNSEEEKNRSTSNSTQQTKQFVTRQDSTSDLIENKSYADKGVQTSWTENILEARVEEDGRYTLLLPSLETLRRMHL